MVAKRLRTVFHRTLPRLRAVLTGGATSQITAVFEVWAVASRYQETDLPKRRPDDESWDDMIARFGDTWT